VLDDEPNAYDDDEIDDDEEAEFEMEEKEQKALDLQPLPCTKDPRLFQV